MSPEQYRALADSRRDAPDFFVWVDDIEDALRAAADQLEAVRIWNQTDERKYVLDRDWLDAILDGETEAIKAAVDTAPQEDRDD